MDRTPITYEETKFEKAIHRLELIEEKVADMMESIGSTLSLLPLNMDVSQEEESSQTQATKDQLSHHIGRFGELLNEVQTDLREQFIFMGDNCIIDNLELPIRSFNGAKQTDEILWRSTLASLNSRCSTDSHLEFKL